MSRHVGEVETLVCQLAADVTALAQLAAAAAEQGGDAGVRAWLLTEDPDQARAALTELVEWLGRVYLRYPGAALPSCWAWHPAVVEELCWLRGAHVDAYRGGEASWARVGEWHDRMRPGVVRRIGEAVGGCELALHLPDEEQAHQPAGVPLARCTGEVATAVAVYGRPPVPTPEQLAAADHHDRAQHRNQH